MEKQQMEKELLVVLEQFENLLNNKLKSNYMPILKNTFLPCLVSAHSEISNIDELFMHEITRANIVQAGIQYVDTTKKVKSVAAVKKYLTAVAEFHKRVIIKKYPNTPLNSINEFQGLFEEIVEKSQKNLMPKISHDQIKDKEAKFILEYLSSLSKNSYKEQVICIVFELMLLYGFKIGTIASLKKDDFSQERRTLMISLPSLHSPIKLELPYKLSKQISDLEANYMNESELLFLADDNKKLDSSYFFEFLKNLEKDTTKTLGTQCTHLTLSGLSKYAVTNMFIKGMNPITISNISGMKDVDLKNCQQAANRVLNSDNFGNSYINSNFRGMEFYEYLN
ncbi:site-specific integrase [Paenibacillus riograndensis]|uniref:Uncharacterized protein n=1 Tax=Paenibacillus riograndensis SBR5 TaxID=1073571 RepID=A0A0E4H9N0_9BACL|nr:tyrosine-type recombinase/integrase [Paenibacillus riograndensis]CQR54400.1 hypothetical protein PRIO_1990 [Paenibacillus riograndensis SBR5]